MNEIRFSLKQFNMPYLRKQTSFNTELNFVNEEEGGLTNEEMKVFEKQFEIKIQDMMREFSI